MTTCKFVLFCSGYYDYQGGYQPHVPGMESFKGKWIHPQAWPKEYVSTAPRNEELVEDSRLTDACPTRSPRTTRARR